MTLSAVLRKTEYDQHNYILSLDQERHKQEFIRKANVISEISRIINECNEVFAKPKHDEVIDEEITIRNNELKYDDEMEGEELWKKLIKFLEKELKLEQERLLIKRRLDGSRQAAESGRAGAYWSLEQADNSSEICGWCNRLYEDRRSLLSNGESGGFQKVLLL